MPASAATRMNVGHHDDGLLTNQLNTPPDPAERTAPDLTPEKDLLLKSQATLESLLSDPDYPSLLSLVTRAKAVLIVPKMFKLSFFLGGHGGSGVLLARGTNGKKWSNPAFYTIGGLNYGLQIGGQSSELILAIMSEKGLQALLEHELTLGGSAGASVGTLGRGAQAATGLGAGADVYAFARSEGLYVGVSLDGTIVTPDPSWNKALYGDGATPDGILVQQKFTSPYADRLVTAMP
ncbi:MAG: lipid-binding SYLF domain-containing protein [Proteobacteria bacterium]|nr:lipid-binding SYLF domain-containing protein [Pseudomonadota bacterium]